MAIAGIKTHQKYSKFAKWDLFKNLMNFHVFVSVFELSRKQTLLFLIYSCDLLLEL